MDNIKNTNLIPPSPNIDIKTLTPFTRFCCSIGAIPASYLVSMTYEEQLLWLCDYLENTVIPTVNNNGEAVTELQGLYTQLKNYVDNYFTNLDVQTEINNKLDEMAESGQLQPLVNNIFETLTNRINYQNERIAQLNTNPPIFVNSIDNMTDTFKLYVLISNNHIYQYNGVNWIDTGSIYSNVDNGITLYETTLGSETAWANFENDYNNLPSNKIFRDNYKGNIANKPFDDFQGTILTLNFTNNINTTDLHGRVQIAISTTNDLCFRIYWGSWKDWNVFKGTPVYSASYNLQILDNWSQFDYDYNNLPKNSIFLCNFYSDNLLNAPAKNFEGTVITLNDNNNGIIQIATDRAGQIYKRYNFTNWLSWRKEGYTSDLFKSFTHVGCIGDSLASGEVIKLINGELKTLDIYNQSWPQYMARKSGQVYYNFSAGGLTTRTWLTNQNYGLNLATDGQHNCDAYIIALGVNDQQAGESYLGTISDIDLSNFNNNPDTFFGNYGKIIQILTSRNPLIKIFMLTAPTSFTNMALYNNAIRQISNLFSNCYLIDLDLKCYNDYNNSNAFIRKNLYNSHYNALAYNAMAEIISNQISITIEENLDDFKDIELIMQNY